MVCFTVLGASPMNLSLPTCKNKYKSEDVSMLNNLTFNNVSVNNYDRIEELTRNVNSKIVSSATNINTNSKQLRKQVQKIIKLMDKVYKKLNHADISGKRDKILKFFKETKEVTKKVAKDTTKAKENLKNAQQKTISAYYDIINLLQKTRGKLSNINDTRLKGVTTQKCQDAGQISNKVFDILEEYNVFWNYLNQIDKKLELNMKFLNTLDGGITLYMNNKCSDKSKPCIYPIQPFESDMGGLETILAEYQKALGELLTTASKFNSNK